MKGRDLLSGKELGQYLKIGDNLKAARNAKGLKQKDAADMFGIPVTTYSNYENGVRTPPLKHLETIAAALGVTVDYLLNGVDPHADALASMERIHNLGDGFYGVGGYRAESSEMKETADAMASSRKLIAVVSNYIHTPETESHVFYSPVADGQKVDTNMSPEDRKAFYGGHVLKVMDEMREEILNPEPPTDKE